MKEIDKEKLKEQQLRKLKNYLTESDLSNPESIQSNINELVKGKGIPKNIVLNTLREMKIEIPNKLETKTKFYPPVNLEEYIKKLHEWFYFTDDEIIEIQLATLIGEEIGGDPLWLFVVAPPGALKTEFLRSFTLSKKFYPLSDLTSKTFVSGLMLGSGEQRRKIEDLLPQLDRKIIIFKDFTTILEKGRDERSEIFAQLREIYDGSFSKKFGTLDKAVRYDSRFGFIAGVTPVIDKHWKLMQQLGERFLKVRWEEDIDEVTIKARENEGKEKQMREEIVSSSMGFITNLDLKNVPSFDDSVYGSQLDEIAKFIAIGRTPVSIQDYRTDFYHDYIPTPERPTRLVKQLKKMCKCLALVRGKPKCDQAEIETIRRIGQDTIPQDRLQILKTIVKREGNTINGCPRPLIYSEVKMPESSIIRVLEQLKMLDLAKIVVVQEQKQSFIAQHHYCKAGDMVKNMLLSTPKSLQQPAGKVRGDMRRKRETQEGCEFNPEEAFK